jgi:adapter protein MecA 1/2
LYEFSTIEDIIQLSEVLYSLGLSGGKLFSFENSFYLLFEETDAGKLDVETFYALLAEYGNPSTRTIYRLLEYGKVLINENAIKQIFSFFSNKKASH